MIQLRALVVDGVVQGFGDTDEWAYYDAWAQDAYIAVGDATATEEFVPWARARGLFVDITIEDAMRIAGGDVAWPHVTPRASFLVRLTATETP